MVNYIDLETPRYFLRYTWHIRSEETMCSSIVQPAYILTAKHHEVLGFQILAKRPAELPTVSGKQRSSKPWYEDYFVYEISYYFNAFEQKFCL